MISLLLVQDRSWLYLGQNLKVVHVQFRNCRNESFFPEKNTDFLSFIKPTFTFLHSCIVAQFQFKVTEFWGDKSFIYPSKSNMVHHIFAVRLAFPVCSLSNGIAVTWPRLPVLHEAYSLKTFFLPHAYWMIHKTRHNSVVSTLSRVLSPCVSPVSSINRSYKITESLNTGLDKRKLAGLHI